MYVNYLEELAQYINLDQLIIPPQVIEYVFLFNYKCFDFILILIAYINF